MKKSYIILGVVLVSILLLLLSVRNSYNTMVTMDEGVTKAWQEVENQYQRRMDLIPNLTNVVYGYADFEKSTLTAVTEARAKATGITVDPSKLDAASIQKFQAAQDQLGGALSRLLVAVERYPELKANQNFLKLQDQLEGTENRISFGRTQFNEAAQEYNTLIRKFPKNLWAGMFGFEKRAYFEAAAGAENAPTVERYESK